MAPLSKAIQTQYAYTRNDETSVYNGQVDEEWTITVPHGGYISCCVLDALLQHQEKKLNTPHHPDPAHLSIQFLTASEIGPFKIEVKPFSISKRWTRLDVALKQIDRKSGKEIIRIRVHAIFSDLPELTNNPIEPGPNSITVLPNTPSPYARICPLSVHPSQAKLTPIYEGFKFKKHVQWAENVEEKRDWKEEKKMEWGCWFGLKGNSTTEEVRRSAAFIPFFADMFQNGAETLPVDQRPLTSWFPTLTLALDFKSKFPLTSTPISSTKSLSIANQTVGLYSYSNFVQDGRHDQIVEVWSSPCNIGEGVSIDKDWRKGCRILAVSTQMALILPAPGRPAKL